MGDTNIQYITETIVYTRFLKKQSTKRNFPGGSVVRSLLLKQEGMGQGTTFERMIQPEGTT